MKALFTSIFLIAALLLGGCAGTQTTSSGKSTPEANIAKAEASMADEGLAVRQQAPDFTYTDLQTGKQVKLSELRGKPVFLNFWATWCPPCVGELPHFQRLYSRYKDKIHFIAVSIDEDAAAPQAFARQKGYDFPIGCGDPQSLGRLYHLEAIPTSYLLDADGRVVNTVLGAMNESALEKFLQQAL